jgi:hypothetical protein
MPQQIVIDIPASLATVIPSADTLMRAGVVLGGAMLCLAAIGLVAGACAAVSAGLKNARKKRETLAQLATLSREQRDQLNAAGLKKFDSKGELPIFAKLDPLTCASLLDSHLIYWGLSAPSGPSNYRRPCYRLRPAHR